MARPIALRFQIDQTDYEQLEALAVEECLPIATYVRRLVRQHLKQPRPAA